jgi:hypothetical protein
MMKMVKEPIMKGFFYALKAMAGTGQENEGGLSREFKYALLMAPVAGKSILKKE